MKDTPVDTYLIRFSAEPGHYTLVIRNTATSAMKLKIESGAGTPFHLIGKETLYYSLRDLVEDNKKQLKLKVPSTPPPSPPHTTRT